MICYRPSLSAYYLVLKRNPQMGDIVDDVLLLYKEKKWKDIVEKYHDHPMRSKLLWVYPSEENLEFMKCCLQELGCDRILSIGCGSGLLEWIIRECTGVDVSGVEVDGAWWHCKYAPPTFIPLILTTATLDKELVCRLERPETALLFCYFNNRCAFNDYLKRYSGNMLIIIGPGYGKAVHTDPRPFDDVFHPWELYKSQEIRSSNDFIAIYTKKYN